METQMQMFYEERQKIAEANEIFLFFVDDGMTREELQQNIDRRPSHWKRFENWLDKLPSSEECSGDVDTRMN